MQILHVSRIPKEERKQLKERHWFVCEACGLKSFHGHPRPSHDEQGYKHEWGSYYEIDLHPSALTEIGVRDNPNAFVASKDLESGKRGMFIYTSYGIKTHEVIIRENIKGTPEYEESSAKVAALLASWENESTQAKGILS